MIGAIAGDIIGSRYEFENIKTKDFELFGDGCRFTDDTVMTCAVAEALMRSWRKDNFETLNEVAKDTLRDIGYWYPRRGYGRRFFQWMYGDDSEPYNSCGNGAAMRISSVGDIARSAEEAADLSLAVTAVTHNHPEGIIGAEAAAVAVFMARTGNDKDSIRTHIENKYYDLTTTVNEYREQLKGHGREICQLSVPQALRCFYEGNSYEDVIRNCISIGGDSDTIAAIAGGVAEAFYGVPIWIEKRAERYLDSTLMGVVERFEEFKDYHVFQRGFYYG